jgi:hypothetical protein
VGGPSVMLLLVWGSFGLVSFSPVCTASALVSLSHSMSEMDWRMSSNAERVVQLSRKQQAEQEQERLY